MSDEVEMVEAPALDGTVKLAHAALSSPEPPHAAETNSRRQVETLMQESALSPHILREAVASQPRHPWWQRLQFWKK